MLVKTQSHLTECGRRVARLLDAVGFVAREAQGIESNAPVAQLAAHLIGNEEVTSSNLVGSSIYAGVTCGSAGEEDAH